MTLSNARALVMLVTLLVYFAYNAIVYEPYTFANSDPGWQITTIESLIEDGDVDIKNQSAEDPQQASDQTAIGKRGEWFPVHESLLPLMTIPFYLLFGVNGCLLFNFLVSLLNAYFCYRLAALYLNPTLAAISSIIVLLNPLLISYSYSYSIDVFAAVIVLVSVFCLFSKQPFFAGVVFGIAVLARLHSVLALPALLLYLMLQPDSRRIRHFFYFLLGGFPLFLIWTGLNIQMFGSPFTTSYNRRQFLRDGELLVVDQGGLFSTQEFFNNTVNFLIHPSQGLLWVAPITVIALLLTIVIARVSYRNEVVFYCAIFIGYFGFYSVFTDPSFNSGPARYFIPVVLLSVVPISTAIACFKKNRS